MDCKTSIIQVSLNLVISKDSEPERFNLEFQIKDENDQINCSLRSLSDELSEFFDNDPSEKEQFLKKTVS